MDSENAGVADTKRFLLDLAEDWQQHGREVFKRVRRESPDNSLSSLTCEQLDQAIEAIEAMLARRAGDRAKVIEGETAKVVPSRRLMYSLTGPLRLRRTMKECKPRKRGPRPV